MDFKQSVLSECEQRYKEMQSGRTPSPFTRENGVKSSSTYKSNNNRYQQRLQQEKTAFNQALHEILSRRNARLNREHEYACAVKRDRKRIIPCICWFVLGVVAAILIPFLAIKGGATYWAKERFIDEMGFDSFFNAFRFMVSSGEEGGKGIEAGIVSAVLGLGIWIALLVLAFKKHVGWLKIVLLAGLILDGAPIFLCIMFVRLLCVPIGYLVSFILTPWGIVALGVIMLILMLIGYGRLEVTKFKVFFWITVGLLVCCTAFGYFKGEELYAPAQAYYSQYDGSSPERAYEAEEGKSYLAYVDEENSTYYFSFKPEANGTYIIRSTGLKSNFNAAVYYEGYEIYKGEKEEDKHFSLKCALVAGETYYIAVYTTHEGHCRVHFDKT